MLILNAFLLFKLFSLKKSHKATLNTLVTAQDNRVVAYNNNFNFNLWNSGISLENVILADSANRAVVINDLFQEEDNLLICRFSELHCRECVTYATVKLIHTTEKISKNHIVFLGSYGNNKNMNFMKDQLGLQDRSVYSVFDLNIPAEEAGFPYYFMLDRTLRVSNLFIPEKLTPELTNNYLKMINKRYFATNKKE
jgi:hypothetical protein